MLVTASRRAEDVVRRVEAGGRSGLVMVLGTGCCDSTAPFLYDRYYPGADVVEIGRVAGVPVFARAWLAALYREGGALEVERPRRLFARDAKRLRFSLVPVQMREVHVRQPYLRARSDHLCGSAFRPDEASARGVGALSRSRRP